MILQGLFNILDLYTNEIDLFYNSIYEYFRERINDKMGEKQISEENAEHIIEDLINHISEILQNLGFEKRSIKLHLSNPILNKDHLYNKKISSIIEIYDKIVSVIYDIFLEKIFHFLVDPEAASIILDLKTEELLPIGFLMELRNLKDEFEISPEKQQNLRRYLEVKDKIVDNFCQNKEKIEEIQHIEDPQTKLQLFYMVYRIIRFFNMKDFFNMSSIKQFIKKNVDDWLDTIPLVSLKNPSPYYCGIYLTNELNIDIPEEEFDMAMYFLLNIYDENIDEFQAPVIEATNKVYYFLKSAWSVDLGLSNAQIKELLKGSEEFFNLNYLKNLETSQLVVILKIYINLGIYQKIESVRIKAIIDEIEKRITKEGIKQYRDGFISAEATYYVLFGHYMRNNLKNLLDYNIIDKILSIIYRNLKMITFTKDTNYDLISELFYSCETLKLMNCIETKSMLIHLARYMFPPQVLRKIEGSKDLFRPLPKYCQYKVSRITGDTIY